jgi:hypothetical protein
MERLTSIAKCECGSELEIYLQPEKKINFLSGYESKAERQLSYICTKCGKESEVQKQDLISILLSNFYVKEI